MPTTITVVPALADKVAGFLKAEALPCEVVTTPGGTVQITQTTEREQSDPATLQAGGWIACADAFAMASSLGVPTRTMSKLFNLVDVRVRECQLGCF